MFSKYQHDKAQNKYFLRIGVKYLCEIQYLHCDVSEALRVSSK